MIARMTIIHKDWEHPPTDWALPEPYFNCTPSRVESGKGKSNGSCRRLFCRKVSPPGLARPECILPLPSLVCLHPTAETRTYRKEPGASTPLPLKCTWATQSTLPHHTDISTIQAQTGYVRRACAPKDARSSRGARTPAGGQQRRH